MSRKRVKTAALSRNQHLVAIADDFELCVRNAHPPPSEAAVSAVLEQVLKMRHDFSAVCTIEEINVDDEALLRSEAGISVNDFPYRHEYVKNAANIEDLVMQLGCAFHSLRKMDTRDRAHVEVVVSSIREHTDEHPNDSDYEDDSDSSSSSSSSASSSSSGEESK